MLKILIFQGDQVKLFEATSVSLDYDRNCGVHSIYFRTAFNEKIKFDYKGKDKEETDYQNYLAYRYFISEASNDYEKIHIFSDKFFYYQSEDGIQYEEDIPF